ncbi:hypothetical protein V8E54_002171 [Elaphomyces granulatus]
MGKLSLTGLDTLSTRQPHRPQYPFGVIETLCIAKSCPKYRPDAPCQLLEKVSACDRTKCSYQVRESSPDMWVFWVHASSAARLEEGYRDIAEGANGRWFMVIDNADDASVFLHPVDEGKVGDNSNKAALSKDLSEYLPQSQHGSTLVTSRSRDVAFRITGDTRDIIPVDPMDEMVAVKSPSFSQRRESIKLNHCDVADLSLLNGRYQQSNEMEDDFEDDIYTLCSYSLIETNADATEFEMHQPVQFSAKSWLELQ